MKLIKIQYPTKNIILTLLNELGVLGILWLSYRSFFLVATNHAGWSNARGGIQKIMGRRGGVRSYFLNIVAYKGWQL